MNKTRATIDNTVFLTVAAFEDYEAKTVALRTSADKHGVTLVFCDTGLSWQGFYQHKVVNMHSHLKRLQDTGKRFAFILDSRDVVFIENVNGIVEKFNAMNTGKAIFNHDMPGGIWPSHNERLRLEMEKSMNSVHARLNAGMVAGEIETLLKIQRYVMDLRQELVQGEPCGEFVRELYREVGPVHLDDDQHLYQICLACHPEWFQIDYDKNLFAVLMCYPNDLQEHSDDPRRHDVINDAAIIHSPWLSRSSDWEDRVLQNGWAK